MVGSEAVPELVRQGEDGLGEGALLAVVQQSDEPGVLARLTQRPQAGQPRGAVVEISGNKTNKFM